MRPVHIGCSGWNYKDWRERVYPKGLPASRWLDYYATLFDTVEVNSTFYRLPSRDAVANWVRSTPDGFVFSIKASRYLTHVKRLRELPERIPRLAERIEPLLETPKMGPVLWQLPANFQRDEERLADALDALPRDWRHCFEFRHPSWFVPEIYELLRRHRVALAIGDDPKRPFQSHERTADWTYRPPAPRRAGQEGQLLDHRARDLEAPDRRLAPRHRGVRLRQQRLGGVRGPQRLVAA